MEATMENLAYSLNNSVQAYSRAQAEFEEAQNAVLTARGDIMVSIERCMAKGFTPEDINETLGDYRLTYDGIRKWWEWDYPGFFKPWERIDP